MGLTACNPVYTGDSPEPERSEFVRQYLKSQGITDETHGTPNDLDYFSAGDVPQSLPDRPTICHGSGISVVVQHSLGFSIVEPLYELNVRQKYAKDGRGANVPVVVRIDPPMGQSALLDRSWVKRLDLDTEYEFFAPLHSKRNRQAAIALTREVLAKTHCRGGKVTEDRSGGVFAESFNGRKKGATGLRVSKGWVVKYRCSRWRAR